MVPVSTLVLWLHVTAIVVWMGGLVTVSFVLASATARGDSPHAVARFAATVAARFQRVSRELVFLILLTGIINLIYVGVARGFSFGSTYVLTLVFKVSLFVAMITIQVWQSFRLAPRIVAMASEMESADQLPVETSRVRRQAMVISTVNFVLAAAAVYLGLGLRYR